MFHILQEVGTELKVSVQTACLPYILPQYCGGRPFEHNLSLFFRYTHLITPQAWAAVQRFGTVS